MAEGKRSFVQLVGICLIALPFPVFLTLVFAVRHASRLLLLVVFVASLYASALVMEWIFFTRPAELKKKLPVNSKELRRKTKEFYDSLPR
jgi:DMSO reductase anchor subunit